MLDHLPANSVNTGKTPTVIGPQLKLAPGTETFATPEKHDLGYWANSLLRRTYRHLFVVPETV